MRVLAYVLFGALSGGMLAMSVATVRWMLHAWRQPETAPSWMSDPALVDPKRTFSLIVPARHEEAVLGATLARLAALDHPAFEIVVVVGHDDDGTRAVAEAAAAASPHVQVVVDRSWPKTKPKALNTGLAACRGDVVGVFDAEDEVSLDVLRQVDAAFERSGADVVQAGVQLVTLRGGWFSLRNCLEYFFWFRSRLHAHAARGFFPLGGNTVFVRRPVMEAVGGWDGECLAEDCELGIRLSSFGFTMAVSYDPYFATREETPTTLRAFVRQRTRWNQGFLQVLRKGMWRRLPSRRQRALAVFVLAFPILQALTALLIPISLVTMFAFKVPLLLAMFGFLPALMAVVTVAFELAGLALLRRTYHLGGGVRDYVALVLTTVPFIVVLAVAAVRAAGREVVGRRGWEKTTHAGVHLRAAD